MVSTANALEGTVEALTDAELRAQFATLGFPNARSLPTALALVREAARRALGMRPYDVQLMAAAALFDGVIAEMKTGEGKTLAIGLAASLAALSRRGVHIAIPNPYLASRDTEAMRPLYEFLALKVGATLPGLSLAEKQAAYAADVTYGVHSELGFDYLRDHLVGNSSQRVQRGLHFSIVDEADLILIDEARTPLIITEPAQEESRLIYVSDRIGKSLREGLHVNVDPKARTAHLTDAGFEAAALAFTRAGLIRDEKALYRPEHLHLMRCLDAALRARFVYRRDRDYVVSEGEALIVDESTGRTLTGRRWQGGVHQAIEAAEGLQVKAESETVAEITYQSYFGLYERLGGLTGTALGAADEFEELYARATLAIPTHRPMIRRDYPDQLFTDRRAKFQAIVEDVYRRHQAKQPVLIGTGSVEESEALSRWFQWAALPHRVLNARQNAEEAAIIREAGCPGAITIATNMAGRGTDIVLGGHRQASAAWDLAERTAVAAGGLHVIGTQRHESRRVDDQLQGRAGRQGNPGSSRFYLSLEDPLLRVFGASHLNALSALLADPTAPFAEGRLIDKVVLRAQASMEALSFGARRALVKTDQVIARQRAEVYGLRELILTGQYPVPALEELLTDVLTRSVATYVADSDEMGLEDLVPLQEALESSFKVILPDLKGPNKPATNQDLTAYVCEATLAAYRASRESAENVLTDRERLCLLTALDRAWREHLTLLDSIREGMHLKSYAQENPDYAFAKDARAAFDAFVLEYESRAVALLTLALNGEAPTTSSLSAPQPVTRLSRLSPCPCGSGRRFKHCHGALAGWPRSQLAAPP